MRSADLAAYRTSPAIALPAGLERGGIRYLNRHVNRHVNRHSRVTSHVTIRSPSRAPCVRSPVMGRYRVMGPVRMCPVCQRPGRLDNRATYCSAACRQEAYRLRQRHAVTPPTPRYVKLTRLVPGKVHGDRSADQIRQRTLVDGLRLEHDAEADGPPSFDVPGIEVVATAGGVTNGLVGAWGPVLTPFLLHRRIPPRYAIGSVNTAEVAVAIVASGSLLASLKGDGIDVATVIAMLVGGVIASPIAAWVIRFLRPRTLGLAVAALLLGTNVRELSGWADLGAERWALYALVVLAVTAGALSPRLIARRAARRTSVSAA